MSLHGLVADYSWSDGAYETPQCLHLFSCFSAQTASFSLNIFELWRISTGKLLWNRTVWIRFVCSLFLAICNSSSSIFSLSFFMLGSSSSMQTTGVWFGNSPVPTKALLLTSGWLLNTASQGMVKRVPFSVITRCDFRPQNQSRLTNDHSLRSR